MISEKQHSGSFFLTDDDLCQIQEIADFYHISRSEVVEWIIAAEVFGYQKGFLLATKRIYARSANEKKKKIQTKKAESKKTPYTYQAQQAKQKCLFDFRY